MTPEDQIQKWSVIDHVITSLNRGDSSLYAVGLSGYYIEGARYSASCLSLDNSATPNIRRTQDGFECDAFFEPYLLREEAKAGKEVLRGVLPGAREGIVRVRLQVKLEDIWAITTYDGAGNQIDLLVDRRTLAKKVELLRRPDVS